MRRNRIIQNDLEYIVKTKLSWDRFRNKIVLVSGANGLIPAYMVETLLYLNEKDPSFNVHLIALVRNHEKAMKRFAYYKGRSDLDFLIQDVSEPVNYDGRIDFVIHAASQASPKYFGKDPVGTLKANTLGTINLLNLANDKHCEGFLFFSSGEVYGRVDSSHLPYREDYYGSIDPLDLKASYTESKRMSETMCIAWNHQFHLTTKIARIFHTYGPGVSLDDGRVFADFANDIINNRNIILHTDGSAVRSFTYLADTTVGLFTVLLKGNPNEAYNIGNGTETTILELAKMLVKLYPEKKLSVIFEKPLEKTDYIASPLLRTTPDVTKLSNLGFKWAISIEQGFRQMIDSFDEPFAVAE